MCKKLFQPNIPAELVLIRHPHAHANIQAEHVRMTGGLTDSAWTVLGIEQADLLCRRFDGDRSVAAIYSSPLRRATRLAEALGLAVSRPVVLRPGLREIDCGEVDGVPLSTIRRDHAREWQVNLDQNDPDFRWPGGESYREFRRRCIDEIDRIAAAHLGQRVLLVTHAGVISQICGHLLGISPARWEPYRPDNTSLTEVRWSSSHGELVRFDDCRHLTAAAPGRRLAV